MGVCIKYWLHVSADSWHEASDVSDCWGRGPRLDGRTFLPFPVELRPDRHYTRAGTVFLLVRPGVVCSNLVGSTGVITGVNNDGMITVSFSGLTQWVYGGGFPLICLQAWQPFVRTVGGRQEQVVR